MLKEEKERKVHCVIDTSALFRYPEQIEALGKSLNRKEFDGENRDGKIVIPEVVRREVNDCFYHFDSKSLTPEEREVKKEYSELIQTQKELIQKQKETEKERKKILFRIKFKLFKKWAAEQNLEAKREKAEIRRLKQEVEELKPEVEKIEAFRERINKAKALIDKELKHNSAWMLKHENPGIMLILTETLLTEPGVYEKIWKPGERVENLAGDSDLIILATAMQLSRHGNVFVVTYDSGLANAIFFVNKELGYRRVISKRDASGPWFKKENNNKKGDREDVQKK